MTTFTYTEAATIVCKAIVDVAPEVEGELDDLDTTSDVFDVLGLDSMDHLTVMEALSEMTGVEIPERQYGLLRSVEAIGKYIAAEAP